VRVGTVSASGQVSWGAATTLAQGATTGQFALDGSMCTGVEMQILSGPPLTSVGVAVTTTAGHNYLVAGPLADAVEPGQWTFAGTASNFAVFRAVYSPEAVWLQPAGSQASATPDTSGGAQVVSTSPNTASIAISTTKPALLVWSTAWDPGWRAEVAGRGGDKSVGVLRVGLVQGVEVPAGASQVRFFYEPAGIVLGSTVTAATLLALFVAGVLYLFASRRRAQNM
jgi:hypothetical protein